MRKLIIATLLAMMLMAGSSMAQARKRSETAPIWFSCGLSIGSWNSLGEGDFLGKTMIGMSVAMDMRPLKAAPDAELQWSVGLPFVITAHQREFSLGGFMLSAQMIPTARVTFQTGSELAISPYVGFGGGVMFHIAEELTSNVFDAVYSFRLGADLMFSEAMGFQLNYTLSSVKYRWKDYGTGREMGGWASESISFNQFSFGVVLHP